MILNNILNIFFFCNFEVNFSKDIDRALDQGFIQEYYCVYAVVKYL